MMEHPFVSNVRSNANDPLSEHFKHVFIKKNIQKCNGHAEDHTGWKLPALLPKVGTTSPSVCSCPRELSMFEKIKTSVNNEISLITFLPHLVAHYYFTYFPPSSHPIVVCFFSVGLSSLIWHFQQVLWVLKFLLSTAQARRQKKLQHSQDLLKMSY